MGTVRELSTDPKNVRRRFVALCKRIDKSNKAFERADRYERIAMVARDVLALLDMRKIDACHGTYVQVDVPRESQNSVPKKFDDLLKLPNLPACNVCAIGGAMVAATLRFDSVPTPKKRPYDEEGTLSSANASYYDPDESCNATSESMSKQARKVFPNVLLRKMEEAFEYGYYDYGFLPAGEERFRAIYQNLVDNDGKFTRRNRNDDVVWPAPR